MPSQSQAIAKTLARETTVSGIGVHSAKPAHAVLSPAPAGTGIVFRRSDLPGRPSIPATSAFVVNTRLCTVIGNDGVTVSTVEHLMAALHGLGVDDALVDVDGPEVPIMDGSSSAFVEAILRAGLRSQGIARPAIKVLSPVRVEEGDAWAEFLPFDGTRYDVAIDFASRAIGSQRLVLDLSPHTFRLHVARARTFGSVQDLLKLRAMGLQLGSSLDNSVGLDGDEVMNPEGLRQPDEFVRHKTLDAVGDLALAGMPFIGEFRSHKGGHTLNAKALLALLSATRSHAVVGARTVPVHSSARPLAAAFAPDR